MNRNINRRKKFVLAVFDLLASDAFFCLFFVFYLKSWIVPFLVNAVGLVFALCAFAVNKILLSLDWYKSLFVDFDHERYPDNVWYRKHDERNFDLINLGSNSSKYAFDYSDLNIKAMNFAPGSQTLIDDFKLVKNFHSILRAGGVVIISIMPFTSVNKKTGFMDAFKYCKTLHSTLIEQKYRRKCAWYARFPVLFGKTAFKALVKKMLGRDRIASPSRVQANPMSEAELEKDAARFVEGWKRQFGISDLSDPLTSENEEGRKVRLEVMRNLIDFCLERGYKPVYVIAPATEYLSQYFTREFKEVYIYGFLKQVCRAIPLLDYSEVFELKDKDLYFNSYFFNERGAKIFTQKVVEDLSREGVLFASRRCTGGGCND